MEIRPIIDLAAAKELGRPVVAAVSVKHPGWYQQRAIKSQFSGPFRALRPMIAGLDRTQREAGQAALARAGLPDFATLAVTDSGLHVLRAGELTGRPVEEVAFLEAHSFRAASRATALLFELTLTLADGRSAVYEASRFGAGHSNSRGIEAVLALGVHHTAATPSAQPNSA